MAVYGEPLRPAADDGAPVAVRRLVNDEIFAIAGRLATNDELSIFEFVCECDDLGCRRLVPMTLATYSASAAGLVVAH